MASDLIKTIRSILNYSPTSDQENLLYALNRFTESQKQNPILIVNGYAGTGKTSLIAAYVKALRLKDRKVVLMAPTGRAAKVFSGFAGYQASTIHRIIYQFDELAAGRMGWIRRKNTRSNTVYIIDEASMISGNSGQFGSHKNSMIKDLLVYAFQQKGNRIIFVGDLAQLPPVGEIQSPALDPNYFKDTTDFPTARISLKEVVRQQLNSGILLNATEVRYLIDKGLQEWPQFNLKTHTDIQAITGYELQAFLEDNLEAYSVDDLILITSSNKRANAFNQQIRSRLLWFEEIISAGDRLMVVKNNYFWLKKDFIANGEIMEVTRVLKTTERFGFEFADLEVKLLDSTHVEVLEVKVLLDTLTVNGPSLDAEQMEKLYKTIEIDYLDVKNDRLRQIKLRNDPWLNALQVKYAYAVTAHKSQGGQWPVVFLEAPYIRNPLPESDDLRWLYTGMTRATDKLFLLNFHDSYFI